jgi:hypothetical protein
MAKNNFKFWVNPESNLLYDTWGSNSTAPTPVFLQGDAVEMEVHLVRWTQGTTRYMEEVPFPDGSTLRLAIGRLDAAATSGTFRLSYGADTTAPIAFNATAAQIQTALNALTSVTAAGGVGVTKLTNSIIKVVFNTAGVNATLACDALALSPPCSSKLITLQAGSSTLPGSYLFKIKQSPVVYQEDWTDLEQPTLMVTTLTANRAKRVTISPDPKTGSWSLTGTEAIDPKIQEDAGDLTNLAQYWGENLSQRLSVGATEQNFQNFQYACTKVETYVWDFSVINNYEIPVGYTMPFTATGDGLVGYVGKKAFIDLNTAEVEYLLDGLSSATAVLELELTDAQGNKQTLLQTAVTIKNDMIDSTSFSPLSLGNSLADAPQDGSLYARKDGEWEAFIPEDNVGIPEAPVDGTPYLRKDGSWSSSIDGGTY